MATVGNINVNLGMSTANFIDGGNKVKKSTAQMLEAVTKDAKKTKAAVESVGDSYQKLGKRIGGYGDLFESLQSLSRGDVINGLKKISMGLDDVEAKGAGVMSKLIPGAVVVAGFGLVADGFAKVTGKAIELRDQLRKGEITFEQFRIKLIQSIPIVGDLVTGFMNVEELLTNSKFISESLKGVWTGIVSVAGNLKAVWTELRDMQEGFHSDTLDIYAELQAKTLELNGQMKEAAEVRVKNRWAEQAIKDAEQFSKKAEALKQRVDAIYSSTGTSSEGQLAELIKQAENTWTAARDNSQFDPIFGLSDKDKKAMEDAEKQIDILNVARENIRKLNAEIAALGDVAGNKSLIQQLVGEKDQARFNALLEQLPDELRMRMRALKATADVELKQLEKKFAESGKGWFANIANSAKSALDNSGVTRWLDDVGTKFKSLQDESERIKEGLKTPVEKLKEQEDRAQQMLSSSLLSQDQFNNYLTNLRKDFVNQNKKESIDYTDIPVREQRFAFETKGKGGFESSQAKRDKAAETTASKVTELLNWLKQQKVTIVGID